MSQTNRHEGDGDRGPQLMMGALDGELSATELIEFDALLAADAELQSEWHRLQQVKEVTSAMTLRAPPEEVWETYWSSVYAQMERGLGWILFSIGTMVAVAYGLWQAALEIMADASIPVVVKAAIFTAVVGVAVLLVSVAREKWFVNRSDPYKDVQR